MHASAVSCLLYVDIATKFIHIGELYNPRLMNVCRLPQSRTDSRASIPRAANGWYSGRQTPHTPLAGEIKMSLATRPLAPTVPNDLEAFFVPFTPNRAFKKAPRLIARAKDMHYITVDGRKVIDG